MYSGIMITSFRIICHAMCASYYVILAFYVILAMIPIFQ